MNYAGSYGRGKHDRPRAKNCGVNGRGQEATLHQHGGRAREVENVEVVTLNCFIRTPWQVGRQPVGYFCGQRVPLQSLVNDVRAARGGAIVAIAVYADDRVKIARVNGGNGGMPVATVGQLRKIYNFRVNVRLTGKEFFDMLRKCRGDLMFLQPVTGCTGAAGMPYVNGYFFVIIHG